MDIGSCKSANSRINIVKKKNNFRTIVKTIEMRIFACYVFKKLSTLIIVKVAMDYKMQIIFNFIKVAEKANSGILRGVSKTKTSKTKTLRP